MVNLVAGFGPLYQIPFTQTPQVAPTNVTTADYSYSLPLRARLTFKTRDGATTLFTYNSFSNTNPIKVTYLDTDNAIGENGTFTINIEDSTGIIDASTLRKCKVYIELGKFPTNLQHFMIGLGNIFTIGRPATRFKQYTITGFGTRYRATRLFIHRRQASNIVSIDDPKVTGDPNYNANRLVRDALEKLSWRPLRDRTIKAITGWLTTGISSKVNINIPVINAPFTYLSDFMDQICAITGAVWFIDYSSGAEVFYLSYSPDLHTGITIKSGDLKVPATDPANLTSYIKTAFNVTDESTGEAGNASRLYTSTIIDQTTVSSSFVNKGSTTLDFKAVGQQVIIDSDARRLDSLAFVLSKVGDPQSPKDRVNGAIILDSGNKPMGTVLQKFEIPLSSIEAEPQTMFVNDISIKESLLEGGQKKIWLVLYQRSGITGDPAHNPAHTVRWHHAGNLNASPALTTYSGTANEGDRDKTLTWSTTNLGPTYTYSVFSDIRRLQSRTNEEVAQDDLTEVFIPTDFLTDPSLISQYLSVQLSQISKARRSISEFRVTVPNNYLFRPYQIVSFADGLSGVTQDFQVNRVRYTISSDTGDIQVGTLHADITLSGLFNSLLENCECL